MLSLIKLASLVCLFLIIAPSLEDQPSPWFGNVSITAKSAEEYELWRPAISCRSALSQTNRFQRNSTIPGVLPGGLHHPIPISQTIPTSKETHLPRILKFTIASYSIDMACPSLSFFGNYYGNLGTLYYGVTQYNADQTAAWGWDAGTNNVENNGFILFMNDITANIVDQQAWKGCLRNMENGKWYSTGSLQYLWDNTYAEYDQCWAANCGPCGPGY